MGNRLPGLLVSRKAKSDVLSYAANYFGVNQNK